MCVNECDNRHMYVNECDNRHTCIWMILWSNILTRHTCIHTGIIIIEDNAFVLIPRICQWRGIRLNDESWQIYLFIFHESEDMIPAF